MARGEADATRFLATDGPDADRSPGAHAAARLRANPRDRLRGGGSPLRPGRRTRKEESLLRRVFLCLVRDDKAASRLRKCFSAGRLVHKVGKMLQNSKLMQVGSRSGDCVAVFSRE